MSKKRRGQLGERNRVRDEVLERDGGCVVALRGLDALGGCWGPLDVHEVQKRSRNPHAWLTPSLCVTICRRHHDLTEAESELATALGLLMPSWSTGSAV